MEYRHFKRPDFVNIICICLIAAVSSNFISKTPQLFCIQVPCHSKISLSEINIGKLTYSADMIEMTVRQDNVVRLVGQACRDAFQIGKTAGGINQKCTLIADQKVAGRQSEFIDGVCVSGDFYYHWFFYHALFFLPYKKFFLKKQVPYSYLPDMLCYSTCFSYFLTIVATPFFLPCFTCYFRFARYSSSCF